ncbi:glycogen/starch/alpha-glucan phosphorylase [Candidatus Venteria ishoeyi]|uniref:glycogen/starch/alpha-glucan phosphorylase n=1 Tax=Candidatus Venteria ishoeyi TaxID=1899563 RepID=UPI0025A667D0|nr:glycogen/starch/alpha-glucan phosphorylase [Candidatus Venteria ishoeyi]MDM8545122.1 glycogen/starch/alpha-glucan phosphorylase [Candidatus Venteria ishoeyi]
MTEHQSSIASSLAAPNMAQTRIALQEGIIHHLSYTIAKDPHTVTPRDWFNIIAYTVRDFLTKQWMKTTRQMYQEDSRRIYYLSMEFLMGRALVNNMLNMDVYDLCREALGALNLPETLLADIEEMESDPALGNGGLGRLAACFLDSMATLNLPGYGYGIRYEYGMFYQRLEKGQQVEQPDNWLRYANPWEFPRAEILYTVHFGGRVEKHYDAQQHLRYKWIDTEPVMAMAYDTPVAGYGGESVNTLRLWSAKSSRDFNLQSFNQGEYLKAVEDKTNSENLSKVLYPDDSTDIGRTLRLRQEYFFVAATVKDILRRYLSVHDDLSKLPEKVAIQLNDTHPALVVPELMRLLMDLHQFEWDEAWSITTRTCAYTNHTLLPEALETWPVSLFESLLPRHLQIIYEINWRLLQDIQRQYPGDSGLAQRMSLIDEDGERRVRMAHLAVVGCHKVNGVAALHTELLKTTLFADFERFYPGKLVNKTNGITPRRWLNEANPALTHLINEHIGKDWLRHLEQLKQLEPLADNADFRTAFQAVKQQNKQRLIDFIQKKLNISLREDALFDVQIKRIHEYKRQLLNVLHIITRYNRIRTTGVKQNIIPRVVIFGGKAAPGYAQAKLIIKLINDVAAIINHDQQVGDKLKVVFIPNYDVSNAQRIIPAADLSEQISTAGTEASGTGNMKLALNGALTIGTLDGANIEIHDEVGADNIFIFGLTTEGVHQLCQQGYNPRDYYQKNYELKQALDMIAEGHFSPEQPDRFRPLVHSLLDGGDYYLLLADYADYIACQERVDALYQQPEEWTRKAIINVANMGKFSSDRTIAEYAKEIWKVEPLK